MVVVEERNNLVFNQLPALEANLPTDPNYNPDLPESVGFKPVYKWGDEKHLIKLIKEFDKESKSIYPLIYQTSNKSDQDTINKSCDTTLIFIIACRNLQTDLLNENRWAMSYKKILYPVVENIVKCFQSSGIYIWNELYSIEEFPNYGENEQNKTTDVWDALLFTTTITIQGDRCINTIRF
jgi:hypothetical protein